MFLIWKKTKYLLENEYSFFHDKFHFLKAVIVMNKKFFVTDICLFFIALFFFFIHLCESVTGQINQMELVVQQEYIQQSCFPRS